MFINEYTMNKQLYKEYVYKYLRKNIMINNFIWSLGLFVEGTEKEFIEFINGKIR